MTRHAADGAGESCAARLLPDVGQPVWGGGPCIRCGRSMVAEASEPRRWAGFILMNAIDYSEARNVGLKRERSLTRWPVPRCSHDSVLP